MSITKEEENLKIKCAITQVAIARIFQHNSEPEPLVQEYSIFLSSLSTHMEKCLSELEVQQFEIMQHQKQF